MVVIPIIPMMNFSQLGDAQFDNGGYSLSAVADSSNNIYVIGGIVEASARRLAVVNASSVWKHQTLRETDCASYFSTSLSCSMSSCSAGVLGTWAYNKVVWRTPSTSGGRCLTGGTPTNKVGDVVENANFTCPCPVCPTLHAPLPTNMIDETYINAYSQETATGQARPLLCLNGYTPSGNFFCRPADSYSAVWQQPYPECKPDPCTAPPDSVAFQDMSVADLAYPCTEASPSRPIADNTSCPMKCVAGYQPQGAGVGGGFFRCVLGSFVSPVCEPQRCTMRPNVANGKISCPSSLVEFGFTCQVICDPGYKLVGNNTVHCVTTSSVPEALVEFTQPGTCVAQSCGVLALKDPQAYVNNYTTGSYTTGDVANVGCAKGYELSATSLPSFSCRAGYNAPEVPSLWMGSLECTRRHCDRSAISHMGFFTCEKAVYGDYCQQECSIGYALQEGNGSYYCNALGNLVGAGVCKEVSCPASVVNSVPNAIGTDCPAKFNSTVRCGLTCQNGYESRGSFSCFYGGFSQMPACVAQGARVDIKRFTLSAWSIRFCILPLSALELASDAGFREDVRLAIADSLEKVELVEVRIDNMVALDEVAALQSGAVVEPRLWIAFKVRSNNDTAVTRWLEEEQALTKARFQSSLQTRAQQRYGATLQICKMLLAPPRLAIDYAAYQSAADADSEQGLMDRLFSTDDQDQATVVLGCIVGILFGCCALACCFPYRGRLLTTYDKRQQGADKGADAGISPDEPIPPISPTAPVHIHPDSPELGFDSPRSYDRMELPEKERQRCVLQ